MPRLLIHYARFGPYHYTRLRSAAELLGPLGWEVQGLETACTDTTYSWDKGKPKPEEAGVITAFPGRVHEKITAAECKEVLHPLLAKLQPDAIAIAGWASPDALACLSWCRKNDVRRIVMSETREADGRRMWWKERIKRYLISRFDAALVGGRSHRDYLVKLGIPADKIRFGYNVVDNAYFANEAEKWRGQGRGDRRSEMRDRDLDLPLSTINHQPSTLNSQPSTTNHEPRTPPYFLASNRFIARKNLSRLIEAYAAYARRVITPPTADRQPPTDLWPLCLLGDGELKAELIAQCPALGLDVIEAAPWEPSPPTSNCSRPAVFFPGFRQIDELPRFYAHACCFVHPALEEPWGLVINEAMACGLPVLSGSNAGAAEELLDDGVNGWRFEAADDSEIVRCLLRIACMTEGERRSFGNASVRILQERCPTEAFGNGLAELLKT